MTPEKLKRANGIQELIEMIDDQLIAWEHQRDPIFPRSTTRVMATDACDVVAWATYRRASIDMLHGKREQLSEDLRGL